MTGTDLYGTARADLAGAIDECPWVLPWQALVLRAAVDIAPTIIRRAIGAYDAWGPVDAALYDSERAVVLATHPEVVEVASEVERRRADYLGLAPGSDDVTTAARGRYGESGGVLGAVGAATAASAEAMGDAAAAVVKGAAAVVTGGAKAAAATAWVWPAILVGGAALVIYATRRH